MSSETSADTTNRSFKANVLEELSSRLLSKNLKIIIYKTIKLSIVLYGCETWFLTREGIRK